MTSFCVTADDIKKHIYFISAKSQDQGNHAMHGDLTSKSDFMGGIFDRWINTIPESIVFNKILLPKISTTKKIEVITDFYFYVPTEDKAGIAPDVIGILVDGKAIPFAVFDDKWKAVPGCPQIEVKSFKKSQKMVSLRNQNYNGKYLVLAETEFRVDYLLPLINPKYFAKEIHDNMIMNDKVFIKSNKQKLLEQPPLIDNSNLNIGYVDLLKVTTVNDFIDMATKCEAKTSIQYFDKITQVTNPNKLKDLKEIPLSSLGKIFKNVDSDSGLFRFDENWYKKSESKSKIKEENYKTIDIFVSDVSSITVLKKLKSKLYIKTNKECTWGEQILESNKVYGIDLVTLSRSGNGEEYFLLKSSISKIRDCEEILLSDIKKALK